MALPVEAAAQARPRPSSAAQELDRIEVGLLLDGIHQHYGFDFRDYAPAPLRRGIEHAMSAEGVLTVSGLQDRVLHDRRAMDRFLAEVGVHVTAFFREPEMFATLRSEVFPLLRTYPSVRIWIAGCATGEEAYSLAVLLDEAAILERCRLYATDMNGEALERGRRGTYAVASLEAAASRYQVAGGRGELEDHFRRRGATATVDGRVRSCITWAEHNLVTDRSFNDFQLVICANVMIYFGRALQRQVHQLLDDSLVVGGFLALGGRESLAANPMKQHYRQLARGAAVFQRVRA
jgi:chemotaxis protein methyltransferase CheR